jgi:hypothetical protein
MMIRPNSITAKIKRKSTGATIANSTTAAPFRRQAGRGFRGPRRAGDLGVFHEDLKANGNRICVFPAWH